MSAGQPTTAAARASLARPRLHGWRRLLPAVVGALVMLLLGPRRALAAPEVSATVSSSSVEVGEEFRVDLTAVTDDGSMPSDPQLTVPTGIIAYSPRLSTRMEMTMVGGTTMTRRSLTATWTLVAEREGNFTIPAPAILVDGTRYTGGGTFFVRVRPSTRFPFPQPPGGGTLDDEGAPLDSKALRLPSGPDPKLFVRAVADKRQVLVGEQVTLSYYLYYRVDFKMTDRREPALADFLRVGLLQSPGTESPVTTRVGNVPFEVRLLDRIAAFPLRAGTLQTGALSAKFSGRHIGSGESRSSNDLTIEVREPPVAGRPLGYRVGDVGQFELSAEVEPREIDQGGAVSVVVRLQGTGAMPSTLRVPQRTGIEWLDPEKRTQTSTPRGRVGGVRTYGYVVRVNEAGDVDLGTIELPYFDPDEGQYDVARAELGRIHVRPSTKAAPTTTPDAGADEAEGTPFADVAPARRALGDWQARGDDSLEPIVLAGLVLVPPLFVLLGLGLRRGAVAFVRRREARRHDPGALAGRALRAARDADDPKEASGAAARAVHNAVEAATKLKSRALLIADLAAELERRGIDPELASETAAVLEACEAMRYLPEADDAAAKAVGARAERVVKRLLRRPEASRGALPERPPGGSREPMASRPSDGGSAK